MSSDATQPLRWPRAYSNHFWHCKYRKHETRAFELRFRPPEVSYPTFSAADGHVSYVCRFSNFVATLYAPPCRHMARPLHSARRHDGCCRRCVHNYRTERAWRLTCLTLPHAAMGRRASTQRRTWFLIARRRAHHMGWQVFKGLLDVYFGQHSSDEGRNEWRRWQDFCGHFYCSRRGEKGQGDACVEGRKGCRDTTRGADENLGLGVGICMAKKERGAKIAVRYQMDVVECKPWEFLSPATTNTSSLNMFCFN